MAGIRKAAMGAGKVLGVGGVLGGGAALAAGIQQIRAYASQADELAKLGKQIGLGVEEQQEWQYAAERSGLDTKLLSKGFEILSKRVGELQTTSSGGALGTFLRDAPAEFRALLKGATSTGEAFDVVQRAIAEAPDQLTKAAIANAAFGRSGLPLIRLLQSETSEIQRLREQAREFGLITEDGASKAEEFTDRMGDMAWATRGLRNAIAGELLPELTPMISDLSKWVAANREIVASNVARVARDIGREIRATDWNMVALGIKAAAAALGVSLLASLGKVAAFIKANPALFALLTATAASLKMIERDQRTSTAGIAAASESDSIVGRAMAARDALVDALAGGKGLGRRALGRRAGADVTDYRSASQAEMESRAHAARVQRLRGGFQGFGGVTEHGEITIKVQAEPGTGARVQSVKQRSPNQHIRVQQTTGGSTVGAF